MTNENGLTIFTHPKQNWVYNLCSNLDLSAPKSSKSGPPQQSLPDVLRNLLRNQSEPLESSTDTTTRWGPEFGPFSPEKLKKRTPATKPPRRSAEPSPEPKWTPGLIHRYYDPRGSGIWTFQPRKAQKADPRNKASQTFCGTFSGTKVNPWTHPHILRLAGVRNLDLSAPKSSKSGPPQVDKQPAPRTQTSASALTGRECQCAVLNVLLFQPPLRTLPQSLLGQERISGHVRPWLAPPPPPILLSSHLPEDCIWEKAICQKNASEKKPSARRMEEWHLRKGLNSNLILLIHAQ